MSNKIIDGNNLKFALQENNKKIKQYIDDNNRFDEIQKYQKYVNTELDFCYLHLGNQEAVTLTQDYVIPFISNNTNMKTNENNYSVYLKAGRNYKISSDIYVSNAGFGVFDIYDITNNTVLQQFVKTTDANTSGITCTVGEIIYTPENDCEIQVKVSGVKDTIKIESLSTRSYFIVQEVGRQIVIDPIEHVNSANGIEDTPVGHIISHMGTTAPNHYLICDGTEYNITDYPYLSQHIKDNFGSFDFFGGDGVTTFAVPDLRGEFLRGTGTATRDTGSGAEVGEHQDPTRHIHFFKDTNGQLKSYGTGRTTPTSDSNKDKLISSGDNKGYLYTQTSYNSDSNITEYTARPTNTSVLYCIKYEPTYYMTTQNTNYVQRNLYSLEEKIIGCWINGKPLYEKTFDNITAAQNTDVKINISNLNYDCIINVDGRFLCQADGQTHWLGISNYYSSSTCIYEYIDNNTKSLIFRANSRPVLNGFISLQYTKTTDAENSFTDDMLDYVQSGNGNCNCEPEEELTEEQIQDLITQAVTEINE